MFAERLGLETGWNCHISFSEKTFGFDDHSTLTAGSEGKMDETADEYLVSRVVPEHDDVSGPAFEGDGEGQSGEPVVDDGSKIEDTEADKKVTGRESGGTPLMCIKLDCSLLNSVLEMILE